MVVVDGMKDVTDLVDDDRPVYYFLDHLHTLAEADLHSIEKKILIIEVGADMKEAGIEKHDEVDLDYVEAVEELHLWISDATSVEIEMSDDDQDLERTLEVLECH